MGSLNLKRGAVYLTEVGEIFLKIREKPIVWIFKAKTTSNSTKYMNSKNNFEKVGLFKIVFTDS